MNSKHQCRRELKLHYQVLQRQLDGLSHEQLLLEAPFRANTFNWLIGHILDGRRRMAEVVEVEPRWDTEPYARYRSESEPVTASSEGVRSLDQLWADLTTSQNQLLDALKEMDDEAWERMVDDSDTSVAAQLSFLSWHETYHIGQSELLRQLAGTDDKII